MRLFLFLVLLGVCGCGDDDGTSGACTLDSQCAPTEQCVDLRCQARAPDAGAPDVPTDAPECSAGELSRAGMCVAECGNPIAMPCDAGDVCDFASGRCIPEGTAGILTGEPIACGAQSCRPGTECGLAGECVAAPPCSLVRCSEDDSVCWGAQCLTERPTGACSPASLERMNTADFATGAFDSEFDDVCNAYVVTMLSGPDYLRQLAPDGTFVEYTGVTNLNMGETAVRRLPDDEFGMGDGPGKVAFTYTCCPTCGCVGDDPQGVAELVRETEPNLPVLLVAMSSQGEGPFDDQSSAARNAGPSGLTWGRDNTLFVGNVQAVGDFVRVDLDSESTETIQTFEARVHAATPFSTTELLVALAGGQVRRISTTGAESQIFAEIGSDVTSLLRDPFGGDVYVSTSEGVIVRYSPQGEPLGEFANPGADGRLAYSPDGFLYYLTAFSPVVSRFPLPASLE